MTSRMQHPAELRERAVAMVFELRAASGSSRGTLASVGQKLGINPETLRNWVEKAEIDSGQRPGTTSDDKKRIAELERENRELRRANEILKAASAYFARELDPRLPRLSSSSIRIRTGSEWSRPARSWKYRRPRTMRRRRVRRIRPRGTGATWS
jgi:transposase